MANESTYTDSVVIAAAKAYLLTLANIIFTTRDLSTIGGIIKTASKIRFGLKALDQPITQTTLASRQQIFLTLDRMCKVYNQQNILITT